MSMNVDGLISGMDTTTLIQQLLQAEAGPKLALQKKLTASETSASAYRTVNTTFAAVRAAADSLLKPESWTATKASSSAPSVAISAGATALSGSLTFTVEKTAKAHSVLFRNGANWTTAKSAYGASSITVKDAAGVDKTPSISITDKNSDGTVSLSEAADAINASSHGLNAAVVQLGANEFSLLVTSKTTGAPSKFRLTAPGTFTEPTQGADAELKVGDGGTTFTVTSPTNTFSSLMPGATITVSKVETTPVTLSVAFDPEAVASKVQTLVDAVNAAISTVKTYTNNSTDSNAALKGDFPVSTLAGQLLDAVSSAVKGVGPSGKDVSPATAGFELSGKDAAKDGKIVFDKSKFLTALKDDPTLAQKIVGGVAAGNGPDLRAGTADDVKANGIAGRLLGVAKAASDATTGSLIKLAQGQDSVAKDLKDRIAAWDLRLAKRKETLTRQFTAMETALSSLKNQSTWLAGQINGLPHS